MKKIVYLNCCIREDESRTLRIASPLIEEIKKHHEVIEIDLFKMDLIPCNKTEFDKKQQGIYNKDYFEYSKLVASCDGLIIAAPFWDMSFPAQLKTFLESISLFDVMFVSDDKKCIGIAKCPFMALITTRGMDISVGDNLEQATPYLKALCWLWGIKDFYCIDAKNFDYASKEKIEEDIEAAIKKGEQLFSKII